MIEAEFRNEEIMNTDAVRNEMCSPQKHGTILETDRYVEAGQETQVNNLSEKQELNPAVQSISWNEATRREYEYRKKMEKFFLHFPDGFELLPIQHQEQNPNLNITGKKRKTPASLAFDDHPKSGNPEILLQRSNDIVKILSLQSKMYVMRQQTSQPLLHCQKCSQQLQQIVPRQLFCQSAPTKLPKAYWCNICRVECTSAENLRMHQQGRRHTNQLELILQEKRKTAGCEVYWCKKCNVPCYGVVSMRQHLRGKRHQGFINAQRVGSSRNVATEQAAMDADGNPISSALCQLEPSDMKINETTIPTSCDSTVPVVHNYRLRTSSWPNCKLKA